MKNILQALDKYYLLSDESKEMLSSKLEAMEMKKDDILIPELKVSPYVFFIEKGAVKNHFIDSEGNRNVVWFGFEGDLCFSLSAYFETDYYHETIELLEDSLIYRVPVSFMHKLYEESIEWSNWARKLLEVHLVKLYKEIDDHRPKSAKERYEHLINSNPNIQKRVPLKDIASYLGVSPVSISRFRKEG